MKPFFISAFFIVAGFVAAYIWYSEFTTIANEDGPVEWVGALSFLFASVFLLRQYIRSSPTDLFVFKHKKSLFLLGLAIIMFVGFGEEISWGQRIFNISTPDSMKEMNIQGEFNLHNLEIFHRRAKHGEKSGIALLLSVEVLFNFFWFGLCVIIPLLSKMSTTARSLLNRMGFPVPPLTIGGLFLLTYAVFKTCAILHSPVEGIMVPARGFGELKEMYYGLLFALYSLQNLDTKN
ncbi:MAG: hypothetical protein KDD25_02365 [Bdellovibrionales bacterium]|nr:hypothetical protein [Bdellovibrionales bacterium]